MIVSIFLFGLALLGLSCQSTEQGYWTKHGVSQALTNQQYPADSQYCERLAERTAGGSEKTRSNLYTKCMQGRGYEWIVEESRSQPAKPTANSTTSVEPCPTGRTIIDSFGFTKCVPFGKKSGGVSPEISGTLTHKETQAEPKRDSSAAVEGTAVEVMPPPENRWRADDRACRQHAQTTLSSSYGVYAACMQEKGWANGKP
ncbi:hypothetical protein [Nitrospira sp. Nam80]